MSDIVPPVPAEVLNSIKAALDPETDLSLIQRVVSSDKSAIVAVMVEGAVALVASFKLHLSAEDVAVLTSITTAGVGWFLHQKLNVKKF